MAAVAAGGLLSLANPPPDLGPVAFVALIPLLWAIRKARARRGAAFGFAFGLTYYGIVLYWLLPFGVIAWLPLVASQAAWAALFGTLLPCLWRDDRPVRSAVAAAAVWTAVDWARGAWPLGGFTWGALGNTQHANSPLLPLASVMGVWGVTFVVMLANGLLLSAGARLLRGAPGLRQRAAAPAILMAIAAGAILLPALIPLPAARGPRLDVAVVQGSVPRALTSDRFLQSDAVAANHIRLNRTLAGNPPDLVVWPENALARDPTVDRSLGAAVSDSIRTVGAPTLVGAVTNAPEGRYYNQAILYSGRGRVVGRYTKLHLVPFGEYVPFHSLLGWTERYRRGNLDLTPGHRLDLFTVDGVKVGTPICFENSFPDLFRRFVALGAKLVVVTTNDSSFLLSPASREHVIMSQLRAVETGRWIVQAAISGESAIVDPHGRVVGHTGLFKRAVLRFTVPTSDARTLYTRLGDWFPWACGLGVVLALMVALTRRRGGRGARPAGPPPAERERAKTTSPDRLAPAPIAGGAPEPRTLVILPTYNERKTIEAVLRGILEAGSNVEALVVDDSSPDGTGDVVEALGKEEWRIRLLRRPAKRGLASAYLEGFSRGLEEGYDVIVEMDADLSHRPEDLPSLLEGSARYDLTIGSRYVDGGGVTNWSRARLGLSRAGNAYAKAMLRMPVTDATSGYRAYRRNVLATLLNDGISSEGYAFQIELAYRAWRKGFTIGEVPITFREREHGKSKLSRRIVAEALVRVGVWGVRDRLGPGRDGRPSAPAHP